MADILIQLIGTFIVGITSAIVIEIPRFLILKTAYVGTTSYLVYLLVEPRVGTIVASFIACLVFASLGHVFARKYKAPVTVFYIPSFFLYVPGIQMYHTALYFIRGDYDMSQYYLTQTLTLAGVIAIAVFLVDSIVDTYFHIRRSYGRNKRLTE